MNNTIGGKTYGMSFDLTYEGLKSTRLPLVPDLGGSFDLTYEGLKSQWLHARSHCN